MNKIYTSLIVCLLPFLSLAQTTKDSTQHYSISAVMEVLRSTHGNAFYGPSLRANYRSGSRWEPGIGLEYAQTPEHHDNGFVLYRLKFIPVYGNLKYNFGGAQKVTAFAELSLGISFNKYDIADERTPKMTSVTREQGFYTYLGGGAKYRLTRDLDLFSGMGLKGYKMSTNSLNINPHGLSFMLGVSIH
jgi:hypothetical protein